MLNVRDITKRYKSLILNCSLKTDNLGKHMIIEHNHQTLSATPEQIATACNVSRSTVWRWHNSDTMPASMKELLFYKLGGAAIPNNPHWLGYRFYDDHLYTPNNFKIGPSELQHYDFTMSRINTLLNEVKRQTEYIEYLERITPRAPVVKFDKKKCRPSATAGKENNRYFEK